MKPYDLAVDFELPAESVGETGSYLIVSTYVPGQGMEVQLTLLVGELWFTGIWFLDGRTT